MKLPTDKYVTPLEDRAAMSNALYAVACQLRSATELHSQQTLYFDASEEVSAIADRLRVPDSIEELFERPFDFSTEVGFASCLWMSGPAGPTNALLWLIHHLIDGDMTLADFESDYSFRFASTDILYVFKRDADYAVYIAATRATRPTGPNSGYAWRFTTDLMDLPVD